jgi:hypothetical protein
VLKPLKVAISAVIKTCRWSHRTSILGAACRNAGRAPSARSVAPTSWSDCRCDRGQCCRQAVERKVGCAFFQTLAPVVEYRQCPMARWALPSESRVASLKDLGYQTHVFEDHDLRAFG